MKHRNIIKQRGRGVFTIILLAALFLPYSAHALTFQEALTHAYENNPQLIAARHTLRATAQEKDIALSGWRPDVEGSAEAGYSWTDTSASSSDSNVPRSVGLTVTQPLYKGGSTDAEIKAAEYEIMAQAALLREEEQRILLAASQAYLDVLQYKLVVDLNEHNVRVLSEQYDAEQQKFDLGDSTLTDVSQAKARLAGSQADLMAARALLDTAKAQFEHYIGLPSVNLVIPDLSVELPTTIQDAVSYALANHPSIIYARNAQKAADKNIDSISGQLLPQIDLVGSALHSEEVSALIDDRQDASLTVRMNIPLYQSGLVRAQKKQAQALASQRMVDISSAERQVQEAVLTAWQNLNATMTALEARRSQVEAADLALEGVREEEKLGARTTLDVLDAEQEALDAKVAYVEAEHNVKLQKLQVLSATGNLVPKIIGMEIAENAAESDNRL